MYRREPIISVAPRALVEASGIQLGLTTTGKTLTLDPDFLERHLLVLGKTGTGKSSILLRIIEGIIEGGRGSVIVFDPHGNLARTVCNRFPEMTTVISPLPVSKDGKEFRISLNALSMDPGEMSTQLAAGWIKEAFSSEGVFSRGTWGPRLEVVFSSILQEILKDRPDANLTDLLDLLIEPSKMRRFIASTSNEKLKAFLKMQISDWKGWNQYISSSINKLLPILNNDGIRSIISGRSDSININSLLEETPAIMIPEIWKEVVPEDTFQIVTVLLLLKLWLSRLGTVNTDSKNLLYIVFDEAQLVPSGILDSLLREGRKFGFRIIMATQFLGSDSGSLSETIRGNVSNVISFSLFERDAYNISNNFFSGTVRERLYDVLKTQAIHKAVLWSQTDAGIAGPLSFNPYRRGDTALPDLFESIRSRSTLRYGVESESGRSNPETDLHEYIIRQLENYLEKKSLQFDRNTSVEGNYPDLFFSHNGTTFFVEVEVSDLVNYGRIHQKILNYSGRKLVFITPPDSSEMLFNKILEDFVKNDSRIFLEVGRKHSDLLSTVSIVEYSDGFKFYSAGKLRQMRLEHLLTGSFAHSLQSLKYTEVRSRIYAKMVRDGQYTIEFPENIIEETFGKVNSEKAKKYLVGDSDKITLEDLFGVKKHD